jgi:hypothetical protein
VKNLTCARRALRATSEPASGLRRSDVEAWAAKAGLDVNPDTSEYLCHYKWGYLDHDLGRWTAVDLDVIFLQILPAKMT